MIVLGVSGSGLASASRVSGYQILGCLARSFRTCANPEGLESAYLKLCDAVGGRNTIRSLDRRWLQCWARDRVRPDSRPISPFILKALDLTPHVIFPGERIDHFMASVVSDHAACLIVSPPSFDSSVPAFATLTSDTFECEDNRLLISDLDFSPAASAIVSDQSWPPIWPHALAYTLKRSL